MNNYEEIQNIICSNYNNDEWGMELLAQKLSEQLCVSAATTECPTSLSCRDCWMRWLKQDQSHAVELK